MKKYFDEPELKRSSLILLGLSFLMLMLCFIIINYDYRKVKADYTKSCMAILGQVSKNHPELSNDIVPIITKGADSASIEAGRKLLSRYGYNENINIVLLPNMGDNYNILLKAIMLFLSIFLIAIFMLNYIEHSRTYEKIENLNTAAQNITDYNFDIGIYKNAEGIFAKLANTFNNMCIIMKTNYDKVQKEKSFLSDTLSDISHQLKTPISSLIIYNDILLYRKIDDKKRIEFLENSKNQLNRIEWLLKSLLQLAKLDAGVIQFESKSCNLNSTVEEAVLTLEPKAEQEGISLSFYSKEDKIMMKHDSNWLCEAVINLVKNALEHTNQGGRVEVYTERTPVSTRIIVKDTGEGIPKDELPFIFKRFYKGKSNKKSDSVGIGLALSKTIIEGHGGIIDVKSKVGEGTTFTISFLFMQ